MRVDIDASGDWDRRIAAATGATVAQVWSSVNTEVRRLLRKIPETLWPRDSGDSLRAWKTKRKVTRRKAEIRVSNLFDYGAIISNSPFIRGRRSVHYRAPERWIAQNWTPILSRAAVRAQAAAVRRASRNADRILAGG